MPLDPQIRLMLDQAADAPSPCSLGIHGARAAYASALKNSTGPCDLGSVENSTVVCDERQIDLRIYTPIGAGPFPLIVFYHGGGFVACSVDTHDGLCRNICAASGYVVVSVDYRLAPEHKYPAGLRDCLSATKWAMANASTFNASPDNVVLIGDSAGGNFAVATALHLRDTGFRRPHGLLLMYPVTAYPREVLPSYKEFERGFGLSRETMEWFWSLYLEDEAQGDLPDVSPLLVPDLSGLPKTLVLTAEYDVLRDEAERFAKRLHEAGGQVHLRRCQGLNHGFLFWTNTVARARNELIFISQWLRDLVEPVGTASSGRLASRV